jgi:UDP-glucuronate decarboxylase
MVEALRLLMTTSDEGTGPINLGNPEEFTILELAQYIIKLGKSKSKIHFEPLHQDDPQKRKPEISLTKEALKWYPKVTLEEGLPKTIDYFDDLLRSPK